MKRVLTLLLALVTVSLAALAAVRLLADRSSAPPQLAALMPTGALLEIEAHDFATLLSDWNDSGEKHLWLLSADYQTFSRSRLYLRLDRGRREFESAAGVPQDMEFLKALAGSESALSLYEIGKLEFLYITRMPAAQASATLLWQKRGDYQARNAAGQAYYIKVDPGSQRTVAFAATSGLVLLATREDLIAEALKLASGQDSPSRSSITSEHWFSQATVAANARGQEGDLRLVLNLAALVRSPYFRSYWIQRNVSDVRRYGSEVCDLYRSSDQLREERILFRAGGASGAAAITSSPDTGLADTGSLIALVPPDAGFYRGWANPSPDEVVVVLAAKVLAPQPSQPLPGNASPVVSLNGGEAGSSSDLESRIDQPPPPPSEGMLAAGPLQVLVENVHPDAVLEIESSRARDGSVLPEHSSAVLVAAAKAWNADEVRTAVKRSVETLWTTSDLGAQWVKTSENGVTFDALDGLTPVEVAARDRVLVLADDPEVMSEILGQPSDRGKIAPVIYAARLRLDLERQPFETITRLIDSAGAQAAPGLPRQPPFFSDNLGSLAQAGRRIDSASIVARDDGSMVRQTVTYHLGGREAAP